MTRKPIDAAFTAEIDQILVGAGKQLDSFVSGYREQAAEFGTTQALANVALALTLLPEGSPAGLLLAAITRLAREQEAGS